MSKVSPYIHLMRPAQYVKNVFIFLPAFFAQRITEGEVLWKTALAFVAFSLTASAVYIINDYRDRESDRAHPVKKHRPLASGAVQPAQAFVQMGLLLILSLGTFAWLDRYALGWALAYLGLNIGYSLGLKRIPIIDIYIIATGFVIRVALGASVMDIPLSMWIILMTFLLALFIGLAKRRDDVILAEEGKKVRKSIDGYNLPFINGAMMIMASVLIVAYISYTISTEVQHKFDSEYLYITVFFVLLGILRYMQITLVEARSGSPTKIVLSDIFLQLTLLGWIIVFFLLIY